MGLICPIPSVWIRVFERLSQIAVSLGAPPPPTPLVLSGWIMSDNVEKYDRWKATVDWAVRWGASHIVEELPPDSMLCGPLLRLDGTPEGAPRCRYWHSSPRRSPPEVELLHAIGILHRDWWAIAGPFLGRATEPTKFTGRKGRRLVVAADASVRPPWGSWHALLDPVGRHEFTRLRAAVNACIAPHEVDHIEFVHDSQPWAN
jgi:hypothetical protein